jgi:phosphoribosyl-AMP cyclohydrolase
MRILMAPSRANGLGGGALAYERNSTQALYGTSTILGMMSMVEIPEGKLIPAIAQDWKTGEVLMLAYINSIALSKTLETGVAHYWSRSRGKLWRKGESSGNEQIVKEILVDCDEDAILLKVEQKGGACHTGYRSCFYRTLDGRIVGKRIFDPDEVYKR